MQTLPITLIEHPDHNYTVGALKKIPNIDGWEAYMGKIYNGKKVIAEFEEDTHGGYPHFYFKTGDERAQFEQIGKDSDSGDAEFLLSELITEKVLSTLFKRYLTGGKLILASSKDYNADSNYEVCLLPITGKPKLGTDMVKKILSEPKNLAQAKAVADMAYTLDGWVKI